MTATIVPLRQDRETLLFLVGLLTELRIEQAVVEWQDRGREHDFAYADCVPFSDGRDPLPPCDVEAS